MKKLNGFLKNNYNYGGNIFKRFIKSKGLVHLEELYKEYGEGLERDDTFITWLYNNIEDKEQWVIVDKYNKEIPWEK